MIPVAEAHALISGKIPPPKKARVPLKDCAKGVLAQDITATFPQPRFDNSAMDGFAVRRENTSSASKENPVRLRLKGVISAGTTAHHLVGEGECYQVMTGAPIPQGADAVVMVEDTSGFSDDGAVEIFKGAAQNQHIRFRGEEIGKGEVLTASGTRIGTAEVGVMASFGYDEVKIFRRPKIALFATGNELKEPGDELKPGQIFNSNLYVFTDLTERVGGKVVLRRVLEDKRESLQTFLAEALQKADIIVSSGGVSMGRYDYVRDVFLELGVEENFWKVAQKPGKPLFFGTAAENLIFGLPGNPVSSFMCFMEYVWPTCERWMGLEPRPKVEVTLAESYPREKMKNRYIFGEAWLENGKLMGRASTKLGSHMFTSTIGANCLLESEPGEGPLMEGETILANPLPWQPIGLER